MKNKKECVKDTTKRIFAKANYDLLLVYELARRLMDCGLSKEEALNSIYRNLPELSDFLGMFFLPIKYINNFHERLKETSYYDYWVRKPERARVVENVLYFRFKPSRNDLRNPNFVFVRFKDDSIVRLGEYRRLILEAFEYFKRLVLSHCELIGFFHRVRGYSFERAIILANISLLLQDMVEFTTVHIRSRIIELETVKQVVADLKKLGVYDLCEEILEYQRYLSIADETVPGFFLLDKFVDEDTGWINYEKIYKHFKFD